jgi:urease alpha subunit
MASGRALVNRELCEAITCALEIADADKSHVVAAMLADALNEAGCDSSTIISAESIQ